MTTPSIRTGFPVVATASAAAPPYNVLTAAFSANAGDELLAVAIGAGLPTVVSRNAGDTAAGALNWVLRFVVRQDYKNTTLNVLGAYQVAFYSAIVPPGGVTERALYVTNTVANDGGSTVTGTVPARLMVVAVDNTNGIGAIAYKGSIAADANSNDITTGQAATQTIKPFGNSSLLLSAGWFANGTAPTASAGCTEVVAPGTDRMPLYSKTGGTAGIATALGSSVTDGSLWALGVIEYLPTDQPKPSRKILVLGDSGIESTHSTYQIPVSVQDNLAPHFEVFAQGVWWAHLPQMKSRWDAEKATLPVMDVAIVQCGGNDLSDGGNVWTTTMETALAAVYADLEAAGIPIAAGTMFGPDVGAGAPAGWYDMRDWITANVPAGTHLYSHQIVSDPATNYLTMLAVNQAADGSHVSATGNALFGANISAWIETLGLVQTARPDADVSAGAWTPSTGATLFGVLDEATTDDADYITTSTNSTAEVGLSAVGTPGSGPQILTYRASGTADKALTVGLYQGATLVEQWATDPVAAAVTEYVRTLTTGITDGSDLRVRFTAADAASPPTPLVSYGAIGTGGSGTTSATPAYPTGISASTSKLFCVVTGRSNTANTAPTMPAGWTKVLDFEGGTGTWGVDAGTRRVTVFQKDTVAGTETGTVTVSLAGTTTNTLRASIVRVEVPAGFGISVTASTGADTTSGTAFSVTGGTALDFVPNDLLLTVVAAAIDSVTHSGAAVTASGVTLGSLSIAATTAVTNGNDHRHLVYLAPVTAGTATVAPNYAVTLGTATSGPAGFLRLRAVAPAGSVRVTQIDFVAPAAVTGDVTLAAAAAAQATGTAALDVQSSGTVVDLGAAGAAQAGGSASLSKTDVLSAAGAAQAAGTAGLSKTDVLSAAGAAQAGGSASLSKTDVLTADGAAQAAGSAALALAVQLAAQASAQAGGTASLSTAGSAELAAAGAAQASGTATLLKGVSLASAGLAVASGSAAMSHGVPLQATAAAVAQAGASLALAVTLGAQAVAQAAGAAGMSLAKPLSAAGAAQAGGTAGLSTLGSVDLAAAGAAQASGSAVLSLLVNISGAAVAQALGTAGLAHGVPLAAAGAAAAGGTAALQVGAATDLTAAGSAQASGGATLWLDVPLSADALAQAQAGGSLTLAVPLSAAALVQAGGSAALAGVVQLSAGGLAFASSSAALQVMGPIAQVARGMTLRGRPRDWTMNEVRRWSMGARRARNWRMA